MSKRAIWVVEYKDGNKWLPSGYSITGLTEELCFVNFTRTFGRVESFEGFRIVKYIPATKKHTGKRRRTANER